MMTRFAPITCSPVQSPSSAVLPIARCRLYIGRTWTVKVRNPRTCSAAAADAVGSAGGAFPDPKEEVYKVFPRRKERDPYKLLGVAREAYFEEVQDARNFLYEEYKWHAPSRESIELAYDTILQEKMNVRNKFGFKPRRNRTQDRYGSSAFLRKLLTSMRGGIAGSKALFRLRVEQDHHSMRRLSFFQQLQQKFEPSVPMPTIVNDGSIFVILALWVRAPLPGCMFLGAGRGGGGQHGRPTRGDPTLPIAAAIALAAYRLLIKGRSATQMDLFFGNSPVWGALGTTFLGLAVGFLIRTGSARISALGFAHETGCQSLSVVPRLVDVPTDSNSLPDWYRGRSLKGAPVHSSNTSHGLPAQVHNPRDAHPNNMERIISEIERLYGERQTEIVAFLFVWATGGVMISVVIPGKAVAAATSAPDCNAHAQTSTPSLAWGGPSGGPERESLIRPSNGPVHGVT
eukprot:jgi/Botrbrau1/4994/Bobra.0396s0020.1